MAVSDGTAAALVELLQGLHDERELAKVRTRLAPNEVAIGMRMGDLFAAAKAHQRMALDQVDRLLDEPAYEARLAALCILDFQARGRLDDAGRQARYDLYLGRHDRITTWDMVDRAAPRVVGGHLTGGSVEPLLGLAASADPLRRRTAITAPLYFVRYGDDADLARELTVAELLAADPEPTVNRAVGTFLRHAGARDPVAVDRFLDEHATVMDRAVLRAAVDKLPAEDRARHLGP